MSKKYDMTIGGESVAADSYTDIRNPANTEEVVGPGASRYPGAPRPGRGRGRQSLRFLATLQ